MAKDIEFDEIRVGDMIRSSRSQVWDTGTSEVTSVEGVVFSLNEYMAVDSHGHTLAGNRDEWKRIVLVSRAAVEEPAVGSIITVKKYAYQKVGSVYVRYPDGWACVGRSDYVTWEDILNYAGLDTVEVIRNGL